MVLHTLYRHSAQHHHYHRRLYSPGWASISSSKCRQRPLSWAFAHQFLQPSLLVSSSNLSIHLVFGRPRPRCPSGFVHNIFLGINKNQLDATVRILIYFTAKSLYVFQMSTASITRSTKNCNRSLRCWS